MKQLLHLVAIGARTPVGLTAESTSAAIRARISRVREHPFMVDAAGEPIRCGRDERLDPDLPVSMRMTELAKLALQQIASKLAAFQMPRAIVPVSMALPEVRPGFDARDAAQVVRDVSAAATGMQFSVEDIGAGHAGALQGLQRAVERIAQGSEVLHVVGGVDSYLAAETLDWLDSDGRLARDQTRGGFPPGEAAAMLALASDDFQRRWRLPSLALVRSVACGRETRDETAPEGLQGEALTDVLLRATAGLSNSSPFVDDFYCDINDERARTTDLGFALLRIGERFRDASRYATSVGQIGDVGAASAALNCILAARAWARSYARGPWAVISGASWSGLRGAATLRQAAS